MEKDLYGQVKASRQQNIEIKLMLTGIIIAFRDWIRYIKLIFKNSDKNRKNRIKKIKQWKKLKRDLKEI